MCKVIATENTHLSITGITVLFSSHAIKEIDACLSSYCVLCKSHILMHVFYLLHLICLFYHCQQIYNDATQLVQVFRHFRNQLDGSELDHSDNEGSLHSTLVDVS